MQLTLERPDHEFFLRARRRHRGVVNERRRPQFRDRAETLLEDWDPADARMRHRPTWRHCWPWILK